MKSADELDEKCEICAEIRRSVAVYVATMVLYRSHDSADILRRYPTLDKLGDQLEDDDTTIREHITEWILIPGTSEDEDGEHDFEMWDCIDHWLVSELVEEGREEATREHERRLTNRKLRQEEQKLEQEKLEALLAKEHALYVPWLADLPARTAHLTGEIIDRIVDPTDQYAQSGRGLRLWRSSHHMRYEVSRAVIRALHPMPDQAKQDRPYREAMSQRMAAVCMTELEASEAHNDGPSTLYRLPSGEWRLHYVPPRVETGVPLPYRKEFWKPFSGKEGEAVRRKRKKTPM